MTNQPKFQTNSKQRLFTCAICKKFTDQTCSLCRKIFYCSAEHQQIDWHMRHKMECQGKILSNPVTLDMQRTTANTQYYNSGSIDIQKKSNQIRLENQSKQFMSLFEHRLILRKKTMDKFIKLTESPQPIQQTEVLAMIRQLNQVSSSLMTLFKPGFIPILQEIHGMTTSNFILKLDQILDLSLLTKYYLLAHKHQEVRRNLFTIYDQLPFYPNNDEKIRRVYENTLKTIIKISEIHCNDRVTEGLFTKFILLIEKFDGIWEQIYAYFNMGNWYLQKTYYHKAIKCFNYSLDIINTHCKSRSQTNDLSALTKADLLFNVSLAQNSIHNEKMAFDNMQESYKLRVKAIGKNSIEASYCLQSLSRWTFTKKYWEDCLEYARECYRVRKLNNINYPKELEAIERLLENIYTELKKQKQKNQSEMNMKPVKYYEALINPKNSDEPSISMPEPRQPFIKQLNSSMKEQLIQPKVEITPEMAQTYTSVQWQKLTKLLYDTDKMMGKQAFRRLIFESQFTQSLNQNQRDVFIKVNKIQ